CGQRLVAPGAATVQRPAAPEGMQTCARCGTLNRVGVPFCQNCGANLRSAASYPAQGAYPVPAAPVPARAPASAQGGAVLGPLVLIIGAVGLAVAWLLPFAYDTSSLYSRSFGSADGYQVAFWRELPEVGSRLADQAYFSVAAPVPVLVLLLAILALAGFFRARPGILQGLGLLIAFFWALSLGVLFVVVEVLGANTTEVTDLLRSLTPAGIIFLLSSLIVLIGLLTRFARS
ncbi:MAG: zinc ribbon domain-containing protein, partial [Chloroflexota bacterium]|nr:zinc ribbon domain-containing protein [Chloroflexota bacterium]